MSGKVLAKALRGMGYEIVRQDGSHLRLTTQRNGQHHLTVPNHDPLKLGTLSGILKAAALHQGMEVGQLVAEIGL